MKLADELRKLNKASEKGIDREMIEAYQYKLYHKGAANIPLAYTRFLEKMNGAVEDGVFFYGIRTSNNMHIKDIYENNLGGNAEHRAKSLTLGENFNEYLCYNWADKSYVIVEKENEVWLKQFEGFEFAWRFFLRDYLK